MSELIDLSERYHLYGVRTREFETDNRDLDPGENAQSQHVEGHVVYTTNSREEANEIARNGGFQREGEPWVAVQGWKDTQAPPAEPTAAPLSQDDF